MDNVLKIMSLEKEELRLKEELKKMQEDIESVRKMKSDLIVLSPIEDAKYLLGKYFKGKENSRFKDCLIRVDMVNESQTAHYALNHSDSRKYSYFCTNIISKDGELYLQTKSYHNSDRLEHDYIEITKEEFEKAVTDIFNDRLSKIIDRACQVCVDKTFNNLHKIFT